MFFGASATQLSYWLKQAKRNLHCEILRCDISSHVAPVNSRGLVICPNLKPTTTRKVIYESTDIDLANSNSK